MLYPTDEAQNTSCGDICDSFCTTGRCLGVCGAVCLTCLLGPAVVAAGSWMGGFGAANSTSKNGATEELSPSQYPSPHT